MNLAAAIFALEAKSARFRGQRMSSAQRRNVATGAQMSNLRATMPRNMTPELQAMAPAMRGAGPKDGFGASKLSARAGGTSAARMKKLGLGVDRAALKRADRLAMKRGKLMAKRGAIR